MEKEADDLLRIIWKDEISNIDKHLPRRRESLRTLLELKKPEITLKNGEKTIIFEKDLEKMASLVPRLLWDEVSLPFVFKRNDDVYELDSEKDLEHWVVDRTLGFTTCSPFLLESYRRRGYYYPHELGRFRKAFPSLVVVSITPRTLEESLERWKDAFE